MKKLLLVPAFILLFAMTSCDETQKIEAIRAGQQTASIIATGVKAVVDVLHASGKLTDAQYAQFTKLYVTYEKADQTLTDGLTAWEAGVSKPPIERLLAFLQNVNKILQDINDLIAIWKTADISRPIQMYLSNWHSVEQYCFR